MVRILIDATSTASVSYNTGIQRVVRRVAECSQPLQKELGIECIPIRVHQRKIYTAWNVAGIYPWDDQLATAIHHAATSVVRTIDQKVKSFSPACGRTLGRVATRTRKLFYPKTLVRNARNAYAIARHRTITLRPNDIVLMLDASWSLPPDLYELGKRNGCYLAQIVYDLIPIAHPQFFSTKLANEFRQWVDYTLAQVDCYWAISNTVRDELYAYHLDRHANQRPHTPTALPPRLPAEHFRSFRLGADLTSGNCRLAPRTSIKHIFASPDPVFFSIGTIEPRKNHRWMIAAFSKYWEQGGAGKLVLAGRVGWLCDDIRKTIEQHPLFGTKLFWYSNSTDDEVQYMYQKARALVFASVAEGFGLPIIESLHQGTEVLASDTAIHREVGGDAITYFSLDNPDQLVSQLHQASHSVGRAGLADLQLVPTWQECTRQLLRDVLELADKHQQSVGSGSPPSIFALSPQSSEAA